MLSMQTLAQYWVHTWHSINGPYQPRWFIWQFEHEFSLPPGFLLPHFFFCSWGAFSPTFSGSPWFLYSQFFLFRFPFKSSALPSFHSTPIFSCSVPIPIFLSSSLSLLAFPLFPLPVSLLRPSFLLTSFLGGSFELHFQGQRKKVGIKEEC